MQNFNNATQKFNQAQPQCCRALKNVNKKNQQNKNKNKWEEEEEEHEKLQIYWMGRIYK